MHHRRTMNRRTLLRSGIGSSAALLLASGQARGQRAESRPIILGQVSLSFYAVTGAVVHELLERLGHRVEVRQGPHEEMFPLLGQGAIDLMAAAWLPEGHAAYWSRYGAAAEEVARLYDGARFFWGVPDYVPENEVATIADLAKPSVAARMTKLIQGIGTGATITTLSQKAVGEYGLDALGYSLRPGMPSEWTEAYDAAVAERRWIVFPTWAPQYFNRDGKLRPLQDPRGTLGSINHASLVGPRDRLKTIPSRTRAILTNIDIGLDGVTEMDWLVNVEKKEPRDAARTWMTANESRVAAWFKV
jgi:glycine betaine/proline transport system substrate-binding protein